MTKPFIVEERDVEAVQLPGGGAFWLLEDAENSHGLFGANRLLLPAGADGTRPHHHTRSTEIFYILSGTMEFLVEGALHQARQGTLISIPPNTTHAFGASSAGPAEFLALLTPGIPRFDYFRQLGRIARGEADWSTMDDLHDRFDVHFDGPPDWR
ncbi:cupin domain-containing protein [Nocardia sp. CDC160]|uniref:cupin domain-containing protein n=1 Tax=Nocardia sp. CDC160 TaxID=3112166 RepID=UPI002DBD1DCF|nr:cupin domain-containing protein [Nocardia sp. CDC160]MEC3916079.1 cupin domain-containing protein [Nocardia sp. CDC160]